MILWLINIDKPNLSGSKHNVVKWYIYGASNRHINFLRCMNWACQDKKPINFDKYFLKLKHDKYCVHKLSTKQESYKGLDLDKEKKHKEIKETQINLWSLVTLLKIITWT